ncbi:MAG: hypothetical protein HY647_09555 [Acidobacteria bacterium]|nr:hypothetical protein [Acidobacteriota bacterium]
MINREQIGAIMLGLSLAAATASQAASVTVPAGVTVSVRMTDALDSKKNRAGETFRALVDSPLTVDGKVVIPKGAEAIGRVTEVGSSGRIMGRPLIAVELTALNFEGKSVAVRTSAYQEGGSSRGRQTAKIAGGGTLLGTIVGLVAGHPWIVTGLGAAAGMAVQTVRGPGQIQIPAESLLLFTLQSPLPLEGDF